jgi:hypothetical protein
MALFFHPSRIIRASGVARSFARLIGANLVATYWHEHEYEAGAFLPRIVTIGAPWNTPPDAVHILDLSQKAVHKALSRLSGHDKKRVAASLGSSLTPSDLFQIQVETALATIRQMGPAAVFDQWVLITLFICLMHARFGPKKDVARRAARDALRLLDAFRPDLSQRMTRVPEQLSELQTRLENLQNEAVKLRRTLDTIGPTDSVLSRARDRFRDGRLNRRDLARWQRMTPNAIAFEILAYPSSRSPCRKASISREGPGEP